MTDPVIELVERVKALPLKDRSRVVELLLDSLRDGSPAEVEAAWDAEVESRLAAHERGELQALDGEEVFAKACRLAFGRHLPRVG